MVVLGVISQLNGSRSRVICLERGRKPSDQHAGKQRELETQESAWKYQHVQPRLELT